MIRSGNDRNLLVLCESIQTQRINFGGNIQIKLKIHRLYEQRTQGDLMRPQG